jgi:uncharacterized protein YkwD
MNASVLPSQSAGAISFDMRRAPLAAMLASFLVPLASCADESLSFVPAETCDPDDTSCQGADDCFALCLCEEGTRESCEDQCGTESDLDFDSIDDGWDPDHAAFEQRVLELTNERRAEGGCCGDEGCFPATDPLKLDERLRRSARFHARAMAEQDFFDHDDLAGRTPFDRIRAAGYRGCAMGENIAAGYQTPQEVVDNWMDSAGHCANILTNSFGYLGVGYAVSDESIFGYFWVQNFGG